MIEDSCGEATLKLTNIAMISVGVVNNILSVFLSVFAHAVRFYIAFSNIAKITIREWTDDKRLLLF